MRIFEGGVMFVVFEIRSSKLQSPVTYQLIQYLA
ncbi:hypothetical protein BVRB_2g040660 [Beta vulgaris subsp. vulgaris]|nr:hypothetical protein BVRB_2g040660 [Beta vulgaris subsp. vulgaris]